MDNSDGEQLIFIYLILDLLCCLWTKLGWVLAQNIYRPLGNHP